MLRRPKVKKAGNPPISRPDGQTWQPPFRAGLTRLRLCTRPSHSEADTPQAKLPAS